MKFNFQSGRHRTNKKGQNLLKQQKPSSQLHSRGVAGVHIMQEVCPKKVFEVSVRAAFSGKTNKEWTVWGSAHPCLNMQVSTWRGLWRILNVLVFQGNRTPPKTVYPKGVLLSEGRNLFVTESSSSVNRLTTRRVDFSEKQGPDGQIALTVNIQKICIV